MFRFALAAYSLLLPMLSSSFARGFGSYPGPRNGEELLSLMRDRYAGKWYRTLTFTQKTTLPDGKVETWSHCNVFDQKTLKASHPFVHPPMVSRAGRLPGARQGNCREAARIEVRLN